jgi:hypothetical protein
MKKFVSLAAAFAATGFCRSAQASGYFDWVDEQMRAAADTRAVVSAQRETPNPDKARLSAPAPGTAGDMAAAKHTNSGPAPSGPADALTIKQP